MQTWLPAARGEPPLDSGDSLVRDGLDRWLALPRRPVLAAGGDPAPVPGATVTGTTRLILCLAGRNAFQSPFGTRLRSCEPEPGGALLVDRRAWNLPLDAYAKEFITVDLRLDYVRFYRRRTNGPGALPADHCRTLLLRQPSTTLRSAADAAESLVFDEGPVLDAAAALFALCARRELDLPWTQVDPAWQRLRDWLEERLHQPISRSDAARAIGCHPVHVSRILARHAHCGFAAWIARQRVERAKDLLADSDLPIAEIAARCGFSTPEWFSSTFRRLAGSPPSQWRRR